jgi:hypothetical protein
MDPSNLTPEQSRRRDHYHESGHAIAAVIRDGFVTSMDFSFEVETTTNLKKADIAVMAWAGPWAQARWEDNCTVERTMELLQTQSFVDWTVYEEAANPRRAAEMDVRRAAFRAEVAFTQGLPKPTDLPSVSPPHPDWHAELTKAWPEIEHLAEALLKGETLIDLRNGQQLVLDENRDYKYWWDPDQPSIVDEEDT